MSGAPDPDLPTTTPSAQARMQVVTTVGLDIAKSVFQVHGVDTAGQVVIRRQLKRRYVLTFFQKLPACLVGIEEGARPHGATDAAGLR